MLNENEKKEIKLILGLLSDKELISLSQTVTNGLITIDSKKSAFDAVLRFTESAGQLLKRRKIKKEVLFQYLDKKGANVSPNLSKEDTVNFILTNWGSKSDLDLKRTNSFEDEDDSQDSQTPYHHNSYLNANQDGAYNRHDEKKPDSVSQELATKFTLWFYKMIDSMCPGSNINSDDEFGVQHFWQDCILKIKIHTTTENFDEEHRAAVNICSRIQQLVLNERMLFMPNMEQGVKGLSEPHGIVKIMVCGMVYRLDNCIGMFEQQFGLIRDPSMQNNYKIKFSDLILKLTHITRPVEGAHQLLHLL